jgi:chromosome segregation ATPase
LTSTRSSLGNSESTLLEKESKLAYVETVNHQLQTRLQKMMDRESSTETYLHDLEAKLNGHTSGEEKNVAIIDELKNEIARVRENEAGCEDYISTLEERLAESEQDMELMQREIDRLEHVVDRQRSLGKLDGLLLELDSMKEKQTNGHDAKDHESDDTEASRPNSSKGRFGNVTDDEITDRSHAFSGTPPIQESPAEDEYVPRSFKEKKSANREDIRNNAVQSQVVTEKLEAVQKELLNLKLEHEQTIRDYEHMNINYEEALRNAASLQDQLDEMRHSKTLTVDGISRETSPPESPIQRPASFLVDGGMSVDLKNSTEQHSSSRSLSSELSLAVIPTDITYGDVIKLNLEAEAVKNASKEKEAMLLRELEQLRKEKEEALRIHEQEQEQLHSQLKTSLDQLADLRLRERINGVSSQLLRRKSSQSLAVIDRAQRAFMSLRRIASEHLGGEPDVLESFDLSLDGALRELLSRSERIQELENEVATLRRDMENKSTMIAGLTRERTSIQSSPMDISVVAVMERRIEENESLLHRAKLQLSERETELASARRALESRSGESQSEAVALLEELTQERKLSAERAAKVVDLQDEVEFIKAHQIQALRSLQQSKDSLEKTLQEIEGELLKTKEAATHHEQQVRETFDREMSDYRERVEGLQKTISENKQTIESQLSRIVELEESRTDAQRHIATQLANTTTSSGDEIKRQQQIITDLEHTISQNREDMTSQKARLDTLERDYDETIQQIDVLKEEKASALAALAESQERAMEEAKVVAAAHEELLATVRNELAESQYTITVHSNNIAALQASCDKAHSLIDKLENEKSYREEGQSDRSQTVEDLELQLADHKETIATHVATLKELQELQQRQELENNQLAEKEENYTKLLEDLEQQLTFTFDQNQNSVKKLDTLQEAYEKVKREHDELSVATELKTAESQKLIESLNDEISKLKVSPYNSSNQTNMLIV